VPYQYFGENALAKMGDLRSKFDVILYPHGGSGVGGGGRGGRGGGAGGAGAGDPVPYKSTKEFPSLGFPDSTDDVRGALGEDGMKALYAFVQKGGTLITEGGTSAILPEMKLTPGVTSETAQGLFARGTILRAVIADATAMQRLDFVRSVLSRRELEVFTQYASGFGVTEIAGRLGRSVKTISAQKCTAMRKLALHSDAELFRFAVEHGVVTEARVEGR